MKINHIKILFTHLNILNAELKTKNNSKNWYNIPIIFLEMYL